MILTICRLVSNNSVHVNHFYIKTVTFKIIVR